MTKAVAAMTVAFLLLSVPGANAGGPLDAVQSAVSSVIKIVSRPDLQGATNRAVRRALLRSVADEFFDFPEMAQRSLGYHRATLSVRERAELVVLDVRTCSAHMGRAVGQQHRRRGRDGVDDADDGLLRDVTLTGPGERQDDRAEQRAAQGRRPRHPRIEIEAGQERRGGPHGGDLRHRDATKITSRAITWMPR
jgi:hypothetical protein